MASLISSRAFALCATLAVLTTGSTAVAQTGTYSSLLRQALAAVSEGKCPTELMSPLVVGTCEQAMPGMGQRLGTLGKITDAKFLGNQQTPQGPTEVYLVTFANGRMTWMIGTGPDGRILVLWTPG